MFLSLFNKVDKLKKTRVMTWIMAELKASRIIHAGLVMAVMGWIPGVNRVFLMLFLGFYAAIKRNAFFAYLHQKSESIASFNIGTWIGNKFNTSPLSVLKFVLSTYILLMSSMPWSMFMIYALYRPREEVLAAIFNQFKAVASPALELFNQLSNVQKLLLTLVAVFITAGMLNSLWMSMTPLGVFDLAMTLVMLALTAAGFRLILTDLAEAISHPLRLVTNKMGILLGAIAGNQLAHAFFFGKISGSLGQTFGSVQSGGLFPSLYNMFFSNNPYGNSKLIFNDTVSGALFNWASTGFGGFLGSIFFSHNLSTYGTIHGVLGPTSYQLFVFMAMGAAVGYFIDKAVDRVSKSVYSDVTSTWENKPESPSYSPKIARLKSLVHFGHNYRLPIISTLVITGLMQALRMPMYMTALHSFNTPFMALVYIEAGLLLPALGLTKIYRVVKQAIAKQKTLAAAALGSADLQGLAVALKEKLDLAAAERAALIAAAEQQEEALPEEQQEQAEAHLQGLEAELNAHIEAYFQPQEAEAPAAVLFSPASSSESAPAFNTRSRSKSRSRSRSVSM